MCDALTTSVDIHATLADIFHTPPVQRTPGRTLVPLLTGAASSVREWAIGGVYGNWVQVTDGWNKYARGPVTDNFPLSMWSNRWSTMPVPGLTNPLPLPDKRARLDFMPGSEIPVIRQPFEPGGALPFWAGMAAVDGHQLYDLRIDPDELENLVGTPREADMLDLLHTALKSVDAPDDQFQRLGIA